MLTNPIIFLAWVTDKITGHRSNSIEHFKSINIVCYVLNQQWWLEQMGKSSTALCNGIVRIQRSHKKMNGDAWKSYLSLYMSRLLAYSFSSKFHMWWQNGEHVVSLYTYINNAMELKCALVHEPWILCATRPSIAFR